MSRLQYDSRYDTSINRLKAMGLSFYVENVGQDECYIAIDMKSVVAMIDKKITYPSREVSLESNTMIIHFWRGMNKGIGKGMVGIGDKSKQKV